MELKYNLNIEQNAIQKNLQKLTNQIYKLLPMREEGLDWKTPLTTIIEEFAGMDRLLLNQKVLFSLVCKLEGLFTLLNEEDFFIYRKTIFECLGLVNEVNKICADQKA